MKTILVIEDKAEVRENIAEMLVLAQYTVAQAADGKRGIELARSIRPDLILCDIMMPELDGYGVLHMIHKDPATAGIPFVFLTAKAEAAHFRSGMDLGADDYLTKPFDDITLLNTVELRLAKSEQTRRHANVDGLTNLLAAVRSASDVPPDAGRNYSTIGYKKKQLLFAEGNLPTALYFIRRGQLKRFKTDALGNELITALSGEDDFVGYAALLQETTYNESAEVLADADLCAITKTDFLSLVDRHPDVADYFMGLLAAEVAERDERLLKLAYQPVRRRVAEALLMVQRKFYPQLGISPDVPVVSEPTTAAVTRALNDQTGTNHLAVQQSLPMALSRENWSNLVGASTETVIRVLSDLRAEGLIDLTGNQVTILDIGRLAHLKH